MSERRELGFPKKNVSNLREQLARTTLQNLRSQGHTYVDLREDGKRFVFFCTLCLAPCYSDSVLLDHLKGQLHKERLLAADATLFGQNPWPFDDGVGFFGSSSRNGKELAIMISSQQNYLKGSCDEGLSIVTYQEKFKSGYEGINNSSGVNWGDHLRPSAETVDVDGTASDLLVSSVLLKGRVVDIRVKFTGLGLISAKFLEGRGKTEGISGVWCEWLGEKVTSGPDDVDIPEHEFAVVTFAYYYELGILENTKFMLTFGLTEHEQSVDSSRKVEGFLSRTEDAGESSNVVGPADHENHVNNCCKRKRSFSEPEDVGEIFNRHYDSSEEGSTASNAGLSKLLVNQNDDQLLCTRFISNKTIRRELRRQEELLSERMCDICQLKMLPGKDVSSILNLKTGKFVCSSRNCTGAFHVFHTSCLIHWLLLCELEFGVNLPLKSKECSNMRNVFASKGNGKGKNEGTICISSSILSVFCPQCQGTGAQLERDQLERDKVSLSQMFRYKIKVSEGRKAWMRRPEKLQHCSTGFQFPYQCEGAIKEKVSPLKMLRFYRADC